MTPHPQLTVAYVGNFRRPWCTEVHVAGSLEALGHRVLRWQEDGVDWRRLPRRVAEEQVGLVLWTRTWSVDNARALDALASLRNVGVPSVSYHLDRWFGLAREPLVDSEAFFRTDVVVSPDDQPEKWAAHGVTHMWLPPGVYAAECGIVAPDPERWPFDVVFVGSVPYPHAEWHPIRQELVDTFTATFGDRFRVLAPAQMGRQIRGRDLQSLYATVPVVLGDSCLAGHPVGYWSDRVPETLGRGGLLLHPDAGERFRTWYIDGRDLLTFPVGEARTAVDLAAEAIDDAGMRATIAAEGRRLVAGRDTYAHRMTTVVDHAATLYGPLRRAEPPVGQRRRVGTRKGSPGHTGGSQAMPGDTITVTHRRSRARGVFAHVPADGHAPAVGEVWTDDTYRLTADQVRAGVVVDIGGNVGAFAVLAAKLGARTVLTYEPQPDNFAALTGNVDRNGVGRIVDPRPWAVDNDAHRVLVGDGGGASFVLRGDTEPDNVRHPERRVVVECVPIHRVLSDAGDVMLMKIDSEGAEYPIVDAMTDADFARVRRIVGEFHGPVMPHLTALDADGRHVERWGAFVAKLATFGKLRIEGRPLVGGLFWWERY